MVVPPIESRGPAPEGELWLRPGRCRPRRNKRMEEDTMGPGDLPLLLFT